MSAVDATGTVPRVVRRRPDTRFLRSELRLVYGRRRNQAGLAALAALPLLLAVALKVTGPDGGDGDGSGGSGGLQFISHITSNGFFVSLAALGLALPLLLPVSVATIAGDSLAGEANTGTLRYLLALPVSRNRLLAVKYAVIVVFAFSVTALMAAVGVLAGLLLFGGGPVTLLSGTQVGLGEGLLRLLGVCAYLSVGLCALGAVGLFVSSLTEQPMGAAIAVTMLSVGSLVLDSIPQVAWAHPYLLTHDWPAFGEFLRDPVGWGGLVDGLLRAGAYIVIFLSAAWARFSSRDVTS